MRNAWTLGVLTAWALALAGCSDVPPASDPFHGPADLGQPLTVDLLNDRQQDVQVRLLLPGQERVVFTLHDADYVPNVQRFYVGSIPSGASFQVVEGPRTLTVTPTPQQPFVSLWAYEDAAGKHLESTLFAQAPVYD